jgi:hypothetical protein|tara:strand:+ start:2431 stop:2700 length:270 start_codon:yes stop_codon:yes gene_type:complete
MIKDNHDKYKPNHWVEGDPLFIDHAGKWNFSSDKPVTHINDFIDYAVVRKNEGVVLDQNTRSIISDIVNTTVKVDDIITKMMNSYHKID